MPKKMKLEIVASDRIFYTGECEEIVFPSIDGFYGVLPGHEPTVACLESGEFRYKSLDGEWHYAAVSDGFLSIQPDEVKVLADTVEKPEEIDEKRAIAAKQRAEERLRQKESLREYYHTQFALNKAMNRLKIKNKHSINL